MQVRLLYRYPYMFLSSAVFKCHFRNLLSIPQLSTMKFTLATTLALTAVLVAFGESTNTATLTCATVKCHGSQACDIFEGKPYCHDVCTPDRCASNEKCVLKQVNCIRAPCPPVPTCVPQPQITCGPFQKIKYDWEQPYCADVCSRGRCKKGEKCKLVDVRCVRPPCPPAAMCFQQSS